VWRSQISYWQDKGLKTTLFGGEAKLRDFKGKKMVKKVSRRLQELQKLKKGLTHNKS